MSCLLAEEGGVSSPESPGSRLRLGKGSGKGSGIAELLGGITSSTGSSIKKYTGSTGSSPTGSPSVQRKSALGRLSMMSGSMLDSLRNLDFTEQAEQTAQEQAEGDLPKNAATGQTQQEASSVTEAKQRSPSPKKQSPAEGDAPSRSQKRASVFGNLKQMMTEAMDSAPLDEGNEESPTTAKKATKFGLSSVANAVSVKVAIATKSIKEMKETASFTLKSADCESEVAEKQSTGEASPKRGSRFGLSSMSKSNSPPSSASPVQESSTTSNAEVVGQTSSGSAIKKSPNTNPGSGSRKSVFGRLSIMSNSILGSLEAVKNEAEQVIHSGEEYPFDLTDSSPTLRS